MIISQLHTNPAEKNALPAAIKKGIEFLEKADFSTLEDKRYEIEGNDIFVIISSYDTQPVEQCKSESHKKFLDIQYIISGEEIIRVGFTNSNNEFATEYLEDKDRWNYKTVVNESDYLMKSGYYAIFFPSDIHRPGCVSAAGVSKVRKAVVKIALTRISQ